MSEYKYPYLTETVPSTNEDVLLALADEEVDAEEFLLQMNLLVGGEDAFQVVGLQMSLATQQAVIRRVARLSLPSPTFNGNRLRVLFELPVETADVPYGKCRYLVEVAEVMEVAATPYKAA